MRHYLSRCLFCPNFRRVRFSPFNRRIFKPRAFGFHSPRLNAAPVHVPPVLSGRFRRPPSTIAPRCSAALWPARSRVPVVGLENRPASRRVTHKLFFLDHRGRRVRFSPGSGLNRDRRFGACGIVRGYVLNLARRYGPRLLRFCVGIWARAFGIASPSLALYVNGGNASRSSVWCGYSAPQPPKNFKRIWAAGQAK